MQNLKLNAIKYKRIKFLVLNDNIVLKSKIKSHQLNSQQGESLMKLTARILLPTLLSFLLVFVFMGQGFAKPTCGILWFYPDKESAEDFESRYITNRYALLLEQLNIYEVLPPEQIEQSLGADQMGEPCREKACATNIGEKIDADYMIYGVPGHVGGLYSLNTTFVNVETNTIVNSTVTDLEGTQDEFIQEAPPHNIRSLLNVQQTPPDWGAPTGPAEVPGEKEKVEEPPPEKPSPETKPAAEPEEEEKAFSIGPRIGLGASDEGVYEYGLGFEVQYSNISLTVLGSDAGFSGGISYYLNATGDSPYLALVGIYYDDEDGGVDEIGRIYGIMAGYRYHLIENLDINAGIGIGYSNWDQTEAPRDNDEELAPLGMITLGYMF